MARLNRNEKLESKRIDQRIERAYYASCSGIQVDIMDIGKIFDAGRQAVAQMDIGKIFDAGRQAVAQGVDDAALTAAIRAFVETIRKN